VIRSRFIGLDTQDPVSYVGAVIVLSGVTLLALLIPAIRALRVDPAAALRWE
jgi:ABC-type antimicrobial peptide transport system permease subunit